MTKIPQPHGENEDWSWHRENGFTPLVNVSGTMTGLGASMASAKVAAATAASMGRFVKIHQMQAKASDTIARLTGAEAGCLTASAAAGITLSVAATMTGMDPAHVERLPKNPGPKTGVAVQLGHLCGYGAPISQAIELAGGTVIQVGQATQVQDYQLEAALGEGTTAALYVVSHHVVHYGQIPFTRFAEICHGKGVPVIVDAASEYDLRGFIAKGADLAVYSGHKFLGGPTSGIIAGRKDLVRAAYLQNIGIGRGMKIGKESLAGAIAAMEAWMERDHAAIRAAERAALELWLKAFSGNPGIRPVITADPTGNPLERMQINVDPALAGTTAAAIARYLGGLEPAVVVRDHEVELGYFQLDPCNLGPGHAEMIAATVGEVLKGASAIPARSDDYDVRRNGIAAYLGWLAG